MIRLWIGSAEGIGDEQGVFLIASHHDIAPVGVFVFPTTLGIEHRIVNGRVYITANPVTDPDEIGRRAAVFGERAGYYYENWDSLYQGWKMRIKGLIDEITSITVP